MLAPYSTKVVTPGKPKPQTKVHYFNLRSLAQKKYLRWENRQPQNARGSKERPPMKKEATSKCKGLKRKTPNDKEAIPKCKGLKRKTSDEKRGNPEMQGAQKERPLIKKEATLKCKGLSVKIPNRKWV
jgi:hypothetical protein